MSNEIGSILHDYEVSPGEFNYPRRVQFNDDGVIINIIERQQGAWLPGLRPVEMRYIDTFDARPIIGVDLEKHELIFEEPPEPNVEDVAASLIQQGITPDMLSQIQETMEQQSTPIRQQIKTTE